MFLPLPITYSLPFVSASSLSTRRTPAALPRTQRTLEFPGAGYGQEPLPRDRESPCRGRWFSSCAAWNHPVMAALRQTGSLGACPPPRKNRPCAFLGNLPGGASVVKGDLRKYMMLMLLTIKDSAAVLKYVPQSLFYGLPEQKYHGFPIKVSTALRSFA